MIRYGRRYDVVPVVEGIVEDDLSGEPCLKRLMHLPLGFIHLVHNFCKDFQPFLCHGMCSPEAGVSDREERRTAPGASYLGEEAMLDGVELGAVRRVVHDENLQPDAVGEVHEILLDDTVPAGVGAAAVAEDDEHFGIRVKVLEVTVPDPLYVVADEFGGVVACTYREISRVVRHVVDAVRHNLASGESIEVVVESLGRGCAVHLPVPLEVAELLLLLGVHADDWDSRLHAGGFRRANLHELGISVLHLAQRKALRERPFLESFSLYHLPYNIVGHVMSTPEELAANLGDTDVEPDHAFVLRKACHVPGNNVPERSHPFGMLVGFPFRTASRHALLAAGRDYMVQKFRNSFGNGIRRTSKSLAYSLYRASRGARRLACNKMPSIAFFECCKVFHFRLANLYWRFLLHHCNDLEINYKDTKISPVVSYLKG